jgi:hypothetical protein
MAAPRAVSSRISSAQVAVDIHAFLCCRINKPACASADRLADPGSNHNQKQALKQVLTPIHRALPGLAQNMRKSTQ